MFLLFPQISWNNWQEMTWATLDIDNDHYIIIYHDILNDHMIWNYHYF